MTTPTAVAQRVWIKDFGEMGLDDIGSVGGKNASLLMRSQLSPERVRYGS